MTLFNIIAPPIIGAIIGYGTNTIAIRMLFRPRKPVMIGRFRVPFTPGVVPKRKDFLAGILGQAISDQFWGLDDLESVFLSEEFTIAVAERVMTILSDPDAKLSFLDPYQAPDSEIMRKLKDELCVRIQAAVLKSGLGEIIIEQAGTLLHERFGNGVVSKVLNEKTITAVSDPIADYIEKQILENGREILMPLIDEELHDLSGEPIANIIENIIPDKDAQCALITSIYTSFMENHARSIVESIDIGGMIAEKVRNMDPADLEELTLSVVKRELRYVELLGGLIGAIIGAVNIFL